jgi:hypothetical protein
LQHGLNFESRLFGLLQAEIIRRKDGKKLRCTFFGRDALGSFDGFCKRFLAKIELCQGEIRAGVMSGEIDRALVCVYCQIELSFRGVNFTEREARLNQIRSRGDSFLRGLLLLFELLFLKIDLGQKRVRFRRLRTLQ